MKEAKIVIIVMKIGYTTIIAHTNLQRTMSPNPIRNSSALPIVTAMIRSLRTLRGVLLRLAMAFFKVVKALARTNVMYTAVNRLTMYMKDVA